MKRTSLTIALLSLALATLTVLGSAPPTLFAQIDPTAQAQTNDAAVAMLFAQTATAAAPLTAVAISNQTATADAHATQTVETMFNQAQTATAIVERAPTQTIEALFNVALTATAIGDVPDYRGYRLIDVQEFELHAAPGRTAAHLSPDGTQFIHFQGRRVCLYALTEGRWAQDRCFEIDINGISNPEEMFWSPAGRYLTLPTFEDGLQRFTDTDIRILDTETETIINFTDDGAEAELMGGETYTGNLDLAARWVDADTIAFIRYGSVSRTDSAGFELLPPAIYTVDLPIDDTLNEPALRMNIPTSNPLPIYVLAVDSRSERVAFIYDTRNDDALQGIWHGQLDGDDLRELSPISESRDLPIQLDYSADGRYLLAFNQNIRQPVIRTVSTETGEITDIDPRFPTSLYAEPVSDPDAPRVVGAGWSPRGSALAYIVHDPRDPEASGLYLTRTAGEPGKLILQGERLYGTTCCVRMPIVWATNDTLMIGRGPEPGVLLVQVGF